MLTKKECKKIIDVITYDPIIFSSFGWDRLLDPNGTCCSPPPKVNNELQTQIEELFDESPKTYELAYELLRGYLEKNWLWRSYTIKAYAILLDGFESYEKTLDMLWQSLNYRKKKIAASMMAIEKLKLEDIRRRN